MRNKTNLKHHKLNFDEARNFSTKYVIPDCQNKQLVPVTNEWCNWPLSTRASDSVRHLDMLFGNCLQSFPSPYERANHTNQIEGKITGVVYTFCPLSNFDRCTLNYLNCDSPFQISWTFSVKLLMPFVIFKTKIVMSID